MKWAAALLALPLVLAACGSDRNATAGMQLFKSAIMDTVRPGRNAAVPAPAITRQALAGFNTPMVMAEIPYLKLTTFLVPFGKNGDVDTWSTTDNRTMSFRQGILVATRGFSADLMQAAAPSIAQIASGSGSYTRSFFYLDGADQTQRHDYQCQLANAGLEQIVVVERQHSTRHVTESCSGKTGNFVNEYWFENGNFLRKSKQLLVQPWGSVTFQRVIDNAAS